LPPAVLQTIEQSAFSTWVRDSPSLFGFWFIISVHAVGMGLLVGSSVIVALRMLGVAPDLPVSVLKRLYPVIWIGFWFQVVSGVVLFIGYPTKSFMTPAFWVKLACIAAAMVVMVRLDRKAFAGRPLAIWSLVLWFGAIASGRLIAYTARYITYP
jgi:hypothetical protein